MLFDPKQHETFLSRKTALYFIRTVYEPAHPRGVAVPVKVRTGYAIRTNGWQFLPKTHR